MLNSLLPLPTFAPPPAPSASRNAGEVSALQSASASEEENVTTVALSGKSSARYPDLTAPLSLLALLGASGALVTASKRKREKEKDGSTEVQRRHQSKVEKRWEEEAKRKRLDAHCGMDSKIDRMEAAEAAAIAAAQEAKRKKDSGGGGKPLHSPTRDGGEPPPETGKIFISITEDELVQLNNLNTMATIIAYIGWFLVGELANVVISTKFPPFALPGAILFGAGGIGYGAYENSVLSSIQSEFNEAVNNGTDVQVWKNGNQIIVYSGVGETVTVVNSLVAKEYINQVVLLKTGERIP